MSAGAAGAATPPAAPSSWLGRLVELLLLLHLHIPRCLLLLPGQESFPHSDGGDGENDDDGDGSDQATSDSVEHPGLHTEALSKAGPAHCRQDKTEGLASDRLTS